MFMMKYTCNYCKKVFTRRITALKCQNKCKIAQSKALYVHTKSGFIGKRELQEFAQSHVRKQ